MLLRTKTYAINCSLPNQSPTVKKLRTGKDSHTELLTNNSTNNSNKSSFILKKLLNIAIFLLLFFSNFLLLYIFYYAVINTNRDFCQEEIRIRRINNQRNFVCVLTISSCNIQQKHFLKTAFCSRRTTLDTLQLLLSRES